MKLRTQIQRTIAGAAVLATTVVAVGCFPGMCLVKVNGRCVVDTCPEHSHLIDEATAQCGCEEGFVTFNGACMALEDANKQCGVGNEYKNGGCMAITCPAGQILNASTGACESRKQTDAVAAKAEGVELKANQTVGCPNGFTYVFAGQAGACVPNESLCGAGTRYQNGKCAAISCPVGQVFDEDTNGCKKLAVADDKTYSVAIKLKASMGPDFCSPLAKNPYAFNVQPGGSKTVRVSVTVNMPGNDIASANVGSLSTIDVGSGQPVPAAWSGVGLIKKQVDDSVLGGIKALGGKSSEASATASVDCKITRAAIQVIETQGGGV